MQAELERNENSNLRKMLDALRKKNEILTDKLKSAGVIKIPQSDVDKKIFFSGNDKMLQECSLISEVHEQIRKSFNIA